MKNLLKLFLLVLILSLSCSDENINEVNNHTPEIVNLSYSPINIRPNETVVLSCIALDSDDDELTYYWESDEGEFISSTVGSSVKWLSPDSQGVYKIYVFVNDSKEILFDSLILRIETKYSKIIGSVIDNESSLPIFGAKITIDSLSSFSDKNGNYIIENINKGEYEITVENENYFTYNGKIVISNYEIAYDVQLECKYAQLSGFVTDSHNGEFLRNIKVNLDTMECITNEEGFYSFGNIEKKIYNLKADDGTLKYPLYNRQITIDKKLSEFNIHLQNVCENQLFLSYGNKIYSTIPIETQCWLKENLDIGVMIKGGEEYQKQSNNEIIEKYCYDNEERNCEIYGGLYQWNEAMQYTTEERSKGICPPNWHIPSLDELLTLKETVNSSSNSLKEANDGSGNYDIGSNESGFTALLGGYMTYDNTFFYRMHEYATIMSSSRSDIKASHYMYLIADNDIIYLNIKNLYYAFSIRCLKD
ncbi:MAG: FISUMP domain-containing protein [Melioribacteraceae bacterium]